MEKVYVTSSNLDWVLYNENDLILTIGFKSGRVYEYYSVPQSVYEGLLNAPSKGSYLNHNIKVTGYFYKKIS